MLRIAIVGLALVVAAPAAALRAPDNVVSEDPYADDASLYAPEDEAAPADETADADDEFGLDSFDIAEPDPLEPVNRKVFGFNQAIDDWLLSPVARGYAFVVPEPGRRAVRRMFENFSLPPVFVNQVLQLRPKGAGVTLARFTINSTVGLVGLFDVAEKMGIDGQRADFGQTLAMVGIGSGPYVVLPVFGPSTVRDAFGDLVDRMLMPQTYFLGLTELLVLGGGQGLVTYEAYQEYLERLRESSVDFYATMRNVYFQNRARELREAGIGVEQGAARPEAADAEGDDLPDVVGEEREPGDAAEPKAALSAAPDPGVTGDQPAAAAQPSDPGAAPEDADRAPPPAAPSPSPPDGTEVAPASP